MTGEKETAGASYILSFYQEVQLLTHNFGNYTNLMLEVKNKYGGKDDAPLIEKLEPEVRDVIIAQVQQVRLGVSKTYIMYRSILKAAPSIKDPHFSGIETSYANIKSVFIIKVDELEKYVIDLNTALVQDIIQSLLNSSQDIYNSIYQQQSKSQVPNA